MNKKSEKNLISIVSVEEIEVQNVTDNPIVDANEAGLVYITDDEKGFTRKRIGEEFIFLDHQGRVIRNSIITERIKRIVIPPAWQRVWISPVRNSHLQATGYDNRGRKQYKYHPDWVLIRNQKKFTRMKEFGELLPLIRQKVEKDLRKKSLSREKVLATVVALLDKTLIRIGNDEYAKENKSFGLTTLRDKHVKNLGGKVRLEFQGKRNIERQLIISDRKLAGIIKRCKEVPGYELFQYVNGSEKHRVHSDDVNDYLKEISGQDITAKFFRTWGGSCVAIKALLSFPEETSEKALKKNIKAAIEEVSTCLGNTPAVCRNYYIHPIIFNHYREKQLLSIVKEKEHEVNDQNTLLKKEELIFLSLLSDNI